MRRGASRRRGRPSIVTTVRRLRRSTGTTQERAASPSTCTVQAPQAATPQPNLVPVRPSSSRSTQSNGFSGRPRRCAAGRSPSALPWSPPPPTCSMNIITEHLASGSANLQSLDQRADQRVDQLGVIRPGEFRMGDEKTRKPVQRAPQRLGNDVRIALGGITPAAASPATSSRNRRNASKAGRLLGGRAIKLVFGGWFFSYRLRRKQGQLIFVAVLKRELQISLQKPFGVYLASSARRSALKSWASRAIRFLNVAWRSSSRISCLSLK